MGWAHPDWSEAIKAGAKTGGRSTAARLHKPAAARAFSHGTGMVIGEPKAPYTAKAAGPVAGSLNIRMWDPAFGARSCKWATNGDGDEHGFLFCGAIKLPGLPYCKAHAEVAFRASPPRPPSAVKDSRPRDAKADDGEPKPLDFERAAA
jgi:hypothetical protein